MSYQQPYYGQPGPQGGPPAGGPPTGYPPQASYQGQPPPPQGYQQNQHGAPNHPPGPGYPPGQPGQGPPGQPYQSQPYYNQSYPQQQQQQQPNQMHPMHPHSPQPPQPYYGQSAPPQGQPPHGQPPHQQYSQQPPLPAPYGGNGPPPVGYGQYQQQPQQYQPPQPQWNQQQPYGAPNAPPPQQYGQQYPPAPGYGNQHVPPTPASSGYDAAQKSFVAPVDTSSDVESIRKAMKGMGCDEKALIKALTSPKYSNPWAMAQLVRDYNGRFIRDMAKDIESETRGDFETTLLALIRGPLENDARILDKSLNRLGTDEEALNDVLLCRSNADLRAIQTEYKRIKNRDLLLDIKDDVDENLYRLYSMILAGTRAEDAAPVIAPEIDGKVTELQRATEGMIGANAISVVQVLSSSSPAQINAIIEAYRRKYHRDLQEVVEKEFRGDMEDALLRMIESAKDRARADAARLRQPLVKSSRKDNLFINRVVALYWDRSRLDAAKAAYKAHFGRTLARDVKDNLSGDYENIILALIGEK